MMVKITLKSVVFSTLILYAGSCQFSKKDTLFTLLPADKTGVTFSNRIVDNDTMNIIDFEYIYNGGGTAIGDFNNDGLADIFFTGNQVSNRLYLNKGDFKFDDITQTAGVSGNGKWCSGVALVDINNDGWLDVYVGATVSKIPKQRENMLFVNQGAKPGQPPVFREMAKEYGIADDGHTTNAAFFDYDNDGDLDLYVLTNTIEQYPNAYHNRLLDGTSLTTDRLYRNDPNPALGHPVFTNVSAKEGILSEGYGLGINITDINRDGWKDVYISNDYLSDDLLWINNANGGKNGPAFTDRAPEYVKHTSSSAMGNDIADLNNDGLADIVALDMLPHDNYRKKTMVGANNYQTYLNNDQFNHTYQFVRNTLQLNQGATPTLSGQSHPVFSDVSLYSNIAETDWSWTPSLVDFDHDGFRDLLISNGFPKDITDRDFVSFRAQSSSVASKSFMLAQIPVIKISNYAFRNQGTKGNEPPIFEDVTEKWGLKIPSFSNGAAYGDLDNDGDVDYVVNNINDSAFVYRNNLVESKTPNTNYLRIKFVGEAQNRMGLGAIVEIKYGNQQQLYENSPYRGYLSTVESVAHFGLGNVQTVDEVRIIWPGLNGKPQRQQTLRNVKANQVLTVEAKNANEPYVPPTQPRPLLQNITDSVGITYAHSEPEYIDFNNQKLLPHKFSQYGPAVSVGDINGDGLDDMFICGSRLNKGHFLIQNPNGTFHEEDRLPEKAIPVKTPIALNSLNQSGNAQDKQQEDMGTLLFDADLDGDLDLYVSCGSIEGNAHTSVFQDRLYVNDGKGNFTLSTNSLPENTTSKSCVKAIDFDRDGDLDLFVGGRVEPDQYPKPVSSMLLRNDSKPGQPQFTDITKEAAPALINIGLVCDALWTDYNNDGWFDLLLAGEFMPLTMLQNVKGTLKPAGIAAFTDQKGWWNSIVSGDFDHDGDTDYIAGNLGLNARMKASGREPVRLYAGDFDNNGFYDAIPTIFIPDQDGVRREYTFHGRDDLIKQMIVMRRRFPLYKDFAQADMDKLLTPEERKQALVLEANDFRSVYLENKGNGQFVMRPLPAQAQLGPIFGMIANDIDQDGNLDVLLVGNDYGGEVLIGRYDALNGLWLKGDGRGNFVPQTLANSGLYVPGNAKALAQLTNPNGQPLWVASQNRGRLLVFAQTQTHQQAIRLKTNDVTAWLTFADGRKEKAECPYGSSFLSQSSRSLYVGKHVKTVEIIDSKGTRRTESLTPTVAVR